MGHLVSIPNIRLLFENKFFLIILNIFLKGTISLPTKRLKVFLNCPVWVSSLWNVDATNYTVISVFLLGITGLLIYYVFSPTKISIESSDLRIVIRHIEVMQQLQEAIIDEAIREQEGSGSDLKVNQNAKLLLPKKKYDLSPLMMKDIQARLRSKRQTSGFNLDSQKTLFGNVTRKIFFSKKSEKSGSVASMKSANLSTAQ